MSTTTKRIAATILSGLLTVQLGVVGTMQILGAEPIATNIRALGFPDGFRIGVGLVQLLAVAGLWLRRWRFAAATSLVVVLLGAVGAHLRVGEGLDKTLPAVVTLLLVTTLAILRVRDRTPQ